MWKFFQKKANRELVGWVCGGLAVLGGAGWAVFTYFVSPESAKQPAPAEVDCSIEAHYSLAACRDLTLRGPVHITGGDRGPQSTK
jgi:hypothetical protein